VEKNPVYRSCVLLVDDIPRSKQFYNIVLGQEIEMDLERYVSFKSGFCIWQKDYGLNLIFNGKATDMPVGENNFEVFFETEDIDALYQRLVKENVNIIHSLMEHPWGQRGFRIRDPDNHIIEFSETMENVVKRFHKQGLSIEEITEKTTMPLEFIETTLKKQE
jgi:catechol 2,3-dioxygenase-like lactoylglutathione lyase family enzyme